MNFTNLVGRSVNIGDNENTYALELIQFFYPDYPILQSDDIFPTAKKFIFVVGRSYGNASNWLDRGDKKVIVVVSKQDSFDFDLTDRLEVLKFVYAKWGIDVEYLLAQDDIENIRRMDLLDFYSFIKPRWVSKDICLCNETTGIINIHSVIGQNFDEILRFSNNITNENIPILEIGFIQFIETARIKKQNRSKAYSRHNELYRKFNENFSNDYIALILSRYREMTNNKRFKLIWLLSQFSFKNVEDD